MTARSAVAPDRDRTRFGAVAAFAVGVALVAFAGAPGIAGGALVVGTWYLLGPTFAFGAGHVAVVGLQGEAGLLAVGAVEIGLLAVLLSPASTVDAPLGPVAVAVGALALGGGAAWATARELVGPGAAGVALTAAIWLAGYGLHRWQLVGLGLVDGADGSDGVAGTGVSRAEPTASERGEADVQ